MNAAADTPTQGHAAPPHGGPRFNALKHSLYSTAILLPGEDPAEFQRRRRALFHTFRPQTVDEAEIVDAMAEHRWLLYRTRPLVAAFDGQTVEPDGDAAGRVSEPVSHTRLHSSIDVGKHRQRLSRAVDRHRARLYEAQRLRRLGLIEGAVKLPKDCYMEVTGQVFGPIAPSAQMPLPEPDIGPVTGTAAPRQVAPQRPEAPPAAAATRSDDRPSAEVREQQETGMAVPRPPVHGPESRSRLAGGVGLRRYSVEPHPPVEDVA